MKKLLAFITIASLTLGTATFVFAEDGDPDVDNQETVEEALEEEPAEEEEAEEIAPITEEIAPIVAVPLIYTETSFTNPEGLIIGAYPVLPGNTVLSARIVGIITDAFQDEYAGIGNENIFSYEVEEAGTGAKIVLNMAIFTSTVTGVTARELAVIYVNTETNEEITAEEFEAMIVPVVEETEEETEEEVVEEVPAAPEETVMVPLRLHAEALGFEVLWNSETASVDVVQGENLTSITTDLNSYRTFTGETIALSSAPVNIDGTTYVPSTFFSEILGAAVVVNADGTVQITAATAPEAVPAAPVEGEEVEDEEVEDEAAEVAEVEAEDEEAPAEGEEEAPE